MNAQRNPIDPSLMNLDSGIFASLPSEVLPLEIFRLESYTEPVNDAEPLLLRRRRHDSLVPSALDASDEPVIAPAAQRRSSWAVGFAVAAGVAIAVTGAARSRTEPAPAAAAIETAPVVETPAPILAAAPAPVSVEPKAAPSPAPIAAAPRAFRLVARPAATPTAAAPPAAAPAVTAEFDRAAVAVAVARVGQRAASCHDEAGTVNVPVAVTFAPSGRVLSARVTGGPLVGTAAGGCLAAALRGAGVPAFAGDPVTVNATVRLH